jgi:glycogen debranching enzyme
MLSVNDEDYWRLAFFLVPTGGSVYKNPTTSVIREWHVGDALRQCVTVVNSGTEPITPTVRMEIAADFADIFEVKDNADLGKRNADIATKVGDGELSIAYSREDFHRATTVTVEGQKEIGYDSVEWKPTIQPGARWQTVIGVQFHNGNRTTSPRSVPASGPHPNMSQSLEEWFASAPTLETDWDALHHTYRRSLADLAALRFYSRLAPHDSMPAAGLPWFMALFGRDSIIASLQLLPFISEPARTTLDVLAGWQATDDDAFRDAEPGKMPHELRHGESVQLHERPQSPYYGSADVTPLYLILLDEYHRFTSDDAAILRHRGTAERALEWIDRHGDRNGDGFVDYQRRNTKTGLENQCWKDSWNSIVYPDGSLPTLPRATCEIQGYVFDAKRRCARIAREVWHDADWADQLDSQAAALHERFNDRYWLEDERFYALALDGEGRAVNTITSNPGHLLWAGIVPPERISPLVDRLMGDDLYSGWGVRTLATGQSVFNPIEYHDGTVWPHDNAIIALGLAQSGHGDAAARITKDVLEAAAQFGYRLPETFAGYAREETGICVRYPSACSPQAWASGAPLMLLRAALKLEPSHPSCVEQRLVNGRYVRLRWQ